MVGLQTLSISFLTMGGSFASAYLYQPGYNSFHASNVQRRTYEPVHTMTYGSQYLNMGDMHKRDVRIPPPSNTVNYDFDYNGYGAMYKRGVQIPNNLHRRKVEYPKELLQKRAVESPTPNLDELYKHGNGANNGRRLNRVWKA